MPDALDTIAYQHTAVVDEPIARQQKLIAQQRELIARMAADGGDITDASAVLAFMLDALDEMERQTMSSKIEDAKSRRATHHRDSARSSGD